MVAAIFAVILFVKVLAGVLKGRSKGLFPMIVRTVGIILSGILSAIISVPLARIVSGALVSKMNEIITDMWPAYGELIALSPSTEDLMIGIPAIFIAIVLYLILFAVIRLLMRIPEKLIKKFVFDKKPEMPKIAWAGALCGVVAGVASFVLVTAPVCGTLATVGSVGDAIIAESAEDDGDFDVYGDFIEPISDGFFVKLTNSLGGEAIYNHLTTIKIDGEKTSMGKEISVFADVLTSIRPLLSDGGVSAMTREDAELLSDASRRLSDSKLISGILSDVLSGAAKKWEKGESFLGMSLPGGEGASADFIREFLLAFKNTTKDTVGEDVGTLADVLVLLVDNGTLKGGSAATDSLGNEGLVSGLLEAVMKNERFSGTAASIINIGVQSTLDTLGVPENNEEIYDSLLSDVASAVNSETDDESFKKKFNESFEKNGIKADRDVTDVMASSLKNDFGERKDVSADEIGDFFRAGFSANAPEARGPRADTLLSILENIRNDRPDAANWEALYSLSARETFVSDSMTYENILVTKGVLDAIDSSLLNAECVKVENIIRKFISFSKTAKGDSVIDNADVASLGAALNIVEESAILSEVSEDMIRAIFSSRLVRNNIKISDKTIENMIVSDDTDYENILVSVQNTSGIINGLGKTEGKLTDEELDKKVEYLLGDMTENTADVIGEVFDTENVQKLGIGDDKAENMSDSLGVFFDKMAESDADTSNPEDKDVKATKAVFKFMAASKTDTSDVFAETGLTPDETVKTFMDSEISRETIIEASFNEGEVAYDSFGLAEKLDDKGRNEALSSMEEHVKANYENEEDKEQYEKTVIALGALLGMDVSDDLASWIK